MPGQSRDWWGQHRRALTILALVFSIQISGAYGQTDRVTVFAAASLADALTEAAVGFEEDTGHEVVLSFAGSAALARQIMLGAPADLYLSADPLWADALRDAGLVEPSGRVDLLRNSLVLIGHGAEGSDPVPPEELDLARVVGSGRLAIGLIDAVPSGRYGRAALEATGLWQFAEPRLAQTDNVRAALALVATGAAPAGIVYSTDARAEPRVHVLSHFPDGSHPPITYPLVDLATADGPSENAFFEYLQGPEAAAIFETHGFDVLQGSTAP